MKNYNQKIDLKEIKKVLNIRHRINKHFYAILGIEISILLILLFLYFYGK
jgi:hypothetical protein